MNKRQRRLKKMMKMAEGIIDVAKAIKMELQDLQEWKAANELARTIEGIAWVLYWNLQETEIKELNMTEGENNEN